MNDDGINRRELLGKATLVTSLGCAIGGHSRAALATDDSRNDPAHTRQPDDHVIFHPPSGDGTMQGFPPSKDKLVTVDNWESTQPRTRWTHLHLRDLVPTQVIRRGTGPVNVLPVRIADVEGIRVPDGTGHRPTLAEWLRQTDTDAFMILHHGHIIREEYFHGMREDEPHLIWSATKSVAVGVVANFISQGKLDIDGKITDYIPEMKGTGYEGATIRHCLDMRSGVAWDNESQGEQNTWTRYSRANGFLARKLPDEPTDEGEWHALMTFKDFGKERARSHGGYFYYKDSDFRVLTWACEKVAGTRFSNLVSQLIWSKLGTEYDADILCDGLGSVSDGMCVTLRDWARWGQVHLNDGRLNGSQIIPKWLIDDIRKNYDADAFTQESIWGPRHGRKESTAYRNLFWIDRHPEGDAFYASGHLGQLCYILPSHGAVLVKFSTWKHSDSLREYLDNFYRDVDGLRHRHVIRLAATIAT